MTMLLLSEVETDRACRIFRSFEQDIVYRPRKSPYERYVTSRAVMRLFDLGQILFRAIADYLRSVRDSTLYTDREIWSDLRTGWMSLCRDLAGIACCKPPPKDSDILGLVDWAEANAW